MMKCIALIFALIYMILLSWISVDCNDEKEHELKYIALFLAGLIPLVICIIIAL